MEGEFVMKRNYSPPKFIISPMSAVEPVCDGSAVWPDDWDSGLTPED